MNAWYKFFYTLVYPFFNIVFRADAVGRENIPEGGALVCCNHSGLSDPVLIVYAFRSNQQLHAMAKMELMKIPVLGYLLKKVGMFGVSRGKSDIDAIKTALRYLKGGEKVLIFPEGTRSDEENAANAKTGAAMLAVRTKVPILPVYVSTQKKRFSRVKVIIGKPYYPSIAGAKATSEEYRVIAGDIMERIYALPKTVIS